MLSTCEKKIFTAMMVLIFIMAVQGLAFGTQITIDSRDDAGAYPAETAFIQFLSNGVTYAGPSSDPGWNSYTDVGAYTNANLIPDPWELQSAGNIWSSDTTVGDSITASIAGTYRITPISGGFYYTYGENAADWRWELQVTWGDGAIKGSQMMGFNDYLDIALAENDWVSLWIWDTNSIDNSGSLTSDITMLTPTPVPEPSTFLLLASGFALLRLGRRSVKKTL